MSEYQYYEFQAVDRPLGRKEQEELRAISTRARITAAGFTNHYEWGDLKANPRTLLERYFDLFLYLANWGSRRFAMRLPEGVVEPEGLECFALDEDLATVHLADGHLIVDIFADEMELDAWDDGGGWLAALSRLRADVSEGDLRLFYLVWLMAVEDGHIRDETPEPLPGIAPLTAALQAFAEFFAIDPDLLDAATQGNPQAAAEPSREAVEAFIRRLPEGEKTSLLLRLHDGDPHVGAEFRRRCRQADQHPTANAPRRTAGELRAAAQRLAVERRRRREEASARAREEHLSNLRSRGEAVWREVEDQVALRNPSGYERATTLLADLREIARESGRAGEFERRLAAIRTRHERKGRFTERLDAAGLGGTAT